MSDDKYIDLEKHPEIMEDVRLTVANDLAFAQLKRSDLPRSIEARVKHIRRLNVLIAIDIAKVLVGLILVLVIWFGGA